MARRILSAVLLAGVLLALGVSGAQAHTTITCDPCSFPYQRWVEEAKVPTPDVTLTVTEASCPWREAVQGCTQEGSSTIWDTAAPGEQRNTFLHELGHNFDFYVLPEWARVRFMALLRFERGWKEEGAVFVADESFAIAYARCAETGAGFHGDPNLGIKEYGGKIRQRTYRALCRLIQAL